MANLKLIFWALSTYLQVKFCHSDYAAMFPYGPKAGDQLSPAEERDFAQSLDVPNDGIVFYGRRHYHLALSTHGTIYFDDSQPAYHTNRPPVFTSPPFIGPLHLDADLLLPNPVAKVYYRYLNQQSESPSLQELNGLINQAVVGMSTFNATYVLIATWVNITDRESVRQCTSSPDQNACENINRNTFQAALIADKNHTFTIFNYARVEEHAIDAQAGIYAGDYVRWMPVLTDGTQKIENLEEIQGTLNEKGRFIFQVSQESVIRGDCSPNKNTGTLMVSPTYAGMYGGEVIEVSGPCLDQNAHVQCKFADTTVMGYVINNKKARCTVPLLKQRGRVELSFSAGNPPRFNYATNFTILLPGPLSAGVSTDYVGPGQGWNETNPSSLTLHWDSDKLSLDPYATVDVYLFGYREDESQSYWTQLISLTTQVPNSYGKVSDSGENTGVTINPSQYRCSNEQCDQFEVGIVQVKLNQGRVNTHSALYSHNLPLGWYLTDAMTERHGDNWPAVLCSEWDTRDSQDTAWIDELLSCPCTMDQAMADFGRWQPDVGCNIFTGSKCTYHRGAVHCVRSVQPTKSGAGNQCCYTADGNLKYAADSFQGSTPDRGHAWGAVPYVEPGYVPEESHWIEDVVTFYYCCLWTDYRDCDKYMMRRPTRDCLNYEPPGAAIAYGDPHITTFDGFSYRFPGIGEYTLVTSGAFTLQGKFTERNLPFSMYNVSVLTGIAVTDNSDRVEIKLESNPSTTNRKLTVMVNEEYKTFKTDEMHWQDFKGVSLVAEKGDYMQDNVTVLLQSGIGVQVAETNGLLHVIVSVPPELKGKTRGLYGVWDDDEGNDLQPRNTSTPVGITSPPDYVYAAFALTWRVPKQDSLFSYPFEMSDDEKSYVPTFADPSNTPPRDIQSVCENIPQCKYDYRVTGRREIAEATFKAAQWYNTLQDFLRPVDTCGLLDVPYAEKDNYDYTAGSVVHITGCRHGYGLQGDTSYTCDPDTNTWQPDVSAKCVDSSQLEEASLAMKIGIGVGIGVVALIVIIIIVVVYLRKKNSSGKGSAPSADSEMRPEPKVPERSQYAPAKTSDDMEEARPTARPRKDKVSEESV